MTLADSRSREANATGSKGTQMPSTSNVLDEARDLVKKRLAELDDERRRLERALAELGGKAEPSAGRLAAPRLVPKKASANKATGGTNAAASPQTPRRHPRRPGGETDREEPGHQRLGDRQDDENQAELPLPGARRPRERGTGQKERPPATSADRSSLRGRPMGRPTLGTLDQAELADRVALLLQLRRRWRRSARARTPGPRAPGRSTTRRRCRRRGGRRRSPRSTP